MRLRFFLGVLLALVVGHTQVQAEPKRVVASIAPIHSLVTSLMRDTGALPKLLMPASQSAHHASLRPSQARALADADLIVWVGPSLERFLARPLKSIAGNAQVLELLSSDGMVLHPARGKHGAHHEHDHRHEAKHNDHHDEGEYGVDPHFWLDPDSAAMAVKNIAHALSLLDPSQKAIYQRNEIRLVKELQELTEVGKNALRKVRSQPVLFHHDGYQYFEKRFDLTASRALLNDEELPVGAAHYSRTEAYLRASEVQCVLTEPQLSQSVIVALAQSASARIATIDPLGADLATGESLYPTLIRNLIGAVRSCLSGE